MAQDTSTSAPEILAKLDGELAQLRMADRREFVSLRTVAAQLAEEISRPHRVLPTGLAAVDRLVGGGLWIGKLYAVAARMKAGKTLTLGTIAHSAARAGRKVLFVALEMGSAGIAQRIVADRLSINSMAFLKRDDPMLCDRVLGFACRDDAELDNLMWQDAPGLDFGQLRSVCLAAAQKGVELLVIDYWQLIQGAAKGQTETQHLGSVAQWLADFARNHDIAVLTAAQINRTGETRGSDGLRLAADWYANLHPAGPNTECDRWLEVLDCRYMPRLDAGSEERGALYVDNIGPALRECRA